MRPTSCRRRGLSAAFVALAIAAVAPAAAGAAPSSTAPGAPGAKALWTPADKQGFGTAMNDPEQGLAHAAGRRADRGLLPRPRHARAARPAARRHRRQDVHRSRDRRDHPARRAGRQAQPDLPPGQHGEVRALPDRQDLRHRPVAQRRCWSTCASSRSPGARTRSTPTSTRRSATTAATTRARTSHGALLTQDASAGERARRRARPSARTSTGYLDASDGWVDLRDDHRMDWHYRSSPNGNVVQTAQTKLDGRRHQHLQLALGFGRHERRGARHRARVAAARLRPRRRRLRRRLAPLPGLAQAPAGQREAAAAPSTTSRSWSWPPTRTRPTAAPSSPRRRCRGRGGRASSSRSPASTTRCGRATSTRSSPG